MEKDKRFAVWVFLLFFVAISSLRAEIFYVDAVSGSDENPGTEREPWRTIAWVNLKMDDATITAGDTICFKRGDVFAGFLDVDRSGSEGNPITFASYGSGPKPIIDANGYLHAIDLRNGIEYINIDNVDVRNAENEAIYGYCNGAHWSVTDCSSDRCSRGAYIISGTFSDINFENYTITNFSDYGIRLNGTFTNLTLDGIMANYGYYGVYSNATVSGIVISNSTFNNNSNGGVILQNVNGLIVTNCETSNNSGIGFNIGGNASDILISGLTSNYNSSYGLIINTTSGINVIIEDSEFIGAQNEKNGLSLCGTGDSCYIKNIVCINNGGDGFNIHGNWTNVLLENCMSAFNGTDGEGTDGDGYSFHDNCSGTMSRCISKENLKSAVAHVDKAQVLMKNCLFYHTTNGTIPMVYLEKAGNYNLYNNVIYSAGQTGTLLGINGANVTAKNNIIFGGRYGINKTTGSVSEDYNIVYGASTCNWCGITPGAHSFSLNPLFNEPNYGDFSLQSISPAIDVGEDLNINKDFTGKPRYDHPYMENRGCAGNYTKTYVDIGAYEFSCLYMGDFAEGNNVDFRDFSVIASAWLTEEGQAGYDPNCDISFPCDRKIDGEDLQILTDNWLLNQCF
jgi:hypothetical protein